MEALWDRTDAVRGQALLLEHFAALERLAEARPSARDRLQRALGGELAGLLVRALAGDHRRSRDV